VVLGLFAAAVGIGATLALAAAAVAAQALTPAGGAIATAFGAVIVVLGGFPFLALLILFVVASVLATRFDFEVKAAKKVQEGTHGERGVSNVLAHILVPTALVILAWADPHILSRDALALLFTSALAFGAADTFASELGVLAGHARSLLTFRSVPPGTNGGVSDVGEAWGFVGALTTAVVGFLLFDLFSAPTPPVATFLVAVTLAGFLGCQLDSILGETLENRGYLTKGSTNFVAMVLSVIVGGAILLLAGVVA
jgi:uncharacterized protein (TIGR00297 family)